ncbi:jg5662 [Pararge aegeria aegeria]|uniref:Jg5662 protein n=1 Tax=Pararge aegeria aegeria TaxID=348720 RepID=A0A8S4QVT0_9NEOP|nr:jg5662 [Pararge aegeria aegeria]
MRRSVEELELTTLPNKSRSEAELKCPWAGNKARRTDGGWDLEWHHHMAVNACIVGPQQGSQTTSNESLGAVGCL